MTCEEISTLTRARTRPLQVTVETSGAFVTFAVVTEGVLVPALHRGESDEAEHGGRGHHPDRNFDPRGHAKAPFRHRTLDSTRLVRIPGGESFRFRDRRRVGNGGQGGIRTPGKDLKPYGGLANRWFKPLTHLSVTAPGREV